ncbi:MAG: efflux RND transporter periplasmic adaptor subunit [Aromatoleum sp.]|jgi:RND family efflux transporter MFP subunit|uniref:efflux RND transporter periplasmic adaptor subunit n=1 Tax=Aromatoleum sp. TaxID=2307007 RepID=UPI0028959379|nr:efflux RND transporter periplasmic adaptor subunit [Aromatoleum sp.]MDT3669659.1 efflux RND transporter periplasmic adaptor subunit [Aromatoleum sp.]
MKIRPLQRRMLTLIAVIVPLVVLLAYVALRSGPLAPVAVAEVRVESRAIRPALFGIGTVEARYTYRIGPTVAGRVKRLDVHVGDRVTAGQVLGEMDPVDLDDRIRSQAAALKRSEAAIREASARQAYANAQARRYEQLFAVRSTSEELLTTKRQELQVAEAALAGVREDLARAASDLEGLRAQRVNLQLTAPVAGIVTQRDADPGTTIVAGQAVVEMVDPKSLWINTRFDQISAAGLDAGLPARIVLRSRNGEVIQGHVLRVEPKADAITEETLAKVRFDEAPAILPPLGELAEVTVDLQPLPAAPVIPNAAVQRQGDRIGVWQIADGEPSFVPVALGRSDLDGQVQVVAGLEPGDHVVAYSEKALGPSSRIRIVERVAGATR